MVTDNSNNLSIRALAQSDFDKLEQEFYEGDDLALIEAIRFSGIYQLPIPDWVSHEMRKHSQNLDINSKITLQTRKRKKMEIHIKLYGQFIYKRVEEERQKGTVIDRVLFDQIGKECFTTKNINTLNKNEQLGARTTEDIYYKIRDKKKF